MRARFIGLALILSLTLGITGCSNNNAKQDNNLSGQVLRLADQAEPQNLDSAATGELYSINMLHNLNEGLYIFDKNEQPALGIAAAEPKVKGLTYTYTLRDAKWSDGKSVTAYDFEYAWKKALDPKFPAQFADMMYFIRGAKEYKAGKSKQVGIKALDKKHIQLTLEHKVPYLKNLLAFATFLPQRKDICEKFGAKYALEAENMVYNGPFKLSSWTHGQGAEYVKNKEYYDYKHVKLEKVIVSFIRENSSQLNMYQTGKIDYMKLSFDQLDKFRNKPDIHTTPDVVSIYLEFNHQKELYKNLKVRQAIATAINKTELTKNIRRDGSKAVSYIVPETIDVYEKHKFRKLFPDVVSEFSSKHAKKLWQQGLKEVGVTNPRIEILISDSTDFKKDAQFIVEQLHKHLGVHDVKVVSVPNKVRLDRASKADFQIMLTSWSADYSDPLTFLNMFVSNSSNNHGRWTDRVYDNLIKLASSNNDFKMRAKQLHNAERMLNHSAVIVPLYYKPRNVALNPRVKNFYIRSIAGDYQFKDAYIKTK